MARPSVNEIKLNSVCTAFEFGRKACSKTANIFDSWNAAGKTVCPLFTIDSPLPKLDVAGSTPVSRSNFSIMYDAIADRNVEKLE